MRHPLERLSPERLRRWTWTLFAAWAVLTVPLLVAARGRVGATLPALAFAGTVERAAAILARWTEADRAAAAWLVRYDFLYDLVHNNAVALACIWAARVLRLPATGAALAWLLWASSAINVVENLVFLRMLRDGAVFPLPQAGAACAGVRTAILAAGLLFGALAAISGGGGRGRRRAGASP